jgi:hypothetical protein
MYPWIYFIQINYVFPSECLTDKYSEKPSLPCLPFTQFLCPFHYNPWNYFLILESGLYLEFLHVHHKQKI